MVSAKGLGDEARQANWAPKTVAVARKLAVILLAHITEGGILLFILE
jgi:hypothetical protein